MLTPFDSCLDSTRYPGLGKLDPGMPHGWARGCTECVRHKQVPISTVMTLDYKALRHPSIKSDVWEIAGDCSKPGFSK